MTSAGSALQLNCASNSVTVTERPQRRPWREWAEVCPNGQCGFWRLPVELDTCIRKLDAQLCVPQQPPRFDIGCQRIDCGGGPLPPIDRTGRLAPAVMLGWFEGTKVDAAKGVRLLRAAERATLPRTGFEAGPGAAPAGSKPLERGAALAVGDLIEIPRGATLSVNTPRGVFKTPKDGLPMEDGQQAWYLLVTGPSVTQGKHQAPPELRWGLSTQDEAFIRAQREKVMGLGMQLKTQRGTYDEALRNSSRVDDPARATK